MCGASCGVQGPLTWPIVRDYVDEVVTVEEHEIALAMRKVSECFWMFEDSQLSNRKDLKRARECVDKYVYVYCCCRHCQVFTGLKGVVEPSGAVVRAIIGHLFPELILENKQDILTILMDY